MAFVISSALPFPNVLWWQQVLRSGSLKIDIAENFGKMSYRNRYHIAGGNGMLRLSIPLEQGRDQKIAMNRLRISNAVQWRKQHWRTLVSAYNRSPYFEYYAAGLQALFDVNYELLIDFNLAGLHWVKQQLKLDFPEEILTVYQKEHPGGTDLRAIKPGNEVFPEGNPPLYHQVFEDRNGFIPNLSILDLLFAEGPICKTLIMK